MEVGLEGVLSARKTIYRHMQPSPLIEHPLLTRYLGFKTRVKHENHNPTGSFKIRGGLNLISRLSPDEKRRGVITATRGNHGQSIALASRIYDVPCTVAVPFGNNPEKNEAMRAFGADLLEHGQDFDDAREKVEELQSRKGLCYVNSAEEPHLINGVASYALEILEQADPPDCILVPIGGGSGVSGILTVIRAVSPKIRVIGVQAAQAPCVYLSWKQGGFVTTESADTIADGLATRVPFEMTLEIIRRWVDEIVTVEEDEIAEAVYHYFRTTHNVAEGAGAAPLAAAKRLSGQLAGKTATLILTGGNIDSRLFAKILSRCGD